MNTSDTVLTIMELLVVASIGVAVAEEIGHDLGFGHPRVPRRPSAAERQANENHPRPKLDLIVGNDHRVAS